MKSTGTILRLFGVVVTLGRGVASLRWDDPKPKRINRAIELLESGQPIYYTGSHSGRTGTFEQGVKDAQTFADYISYDMEHAPFDVKGLSEYMKGLVKGGPTKSGHRTPAVIVNVNRLGFLHCSKTCRRNLLEPPCTDPYARWCGRGRRVTAAPMPSVPSMFDSSKVKVLFTT